MTVSWGYREIDPDLVETLVNNMERDGWIPSYVPTLIQVEGQLQIVDGNHRFTAYRRYLSTLEPEVQNSKVISLVRNQKLSKILSRNGSNATLSLPNGILSVFAISLQVSGC